jgi:predicted patatin/cPLA2 family phospholipase
MPLVAGSPVRINGDRFLDASVFEAVPVNAALQDNCTHVLVLLTRPEGQLKQPHLFDQEIIAPRLDRLRTGLGSSYLNSNNVYNRSLKGCLSILGIKAW